MTYRKIDPADLDQHIGRYATVLSDYGWDMNDWPDWGYIRGVEDGYLYLQDGDEEYETLDDLGGIPIAHITAVSVSY